MPQLAAIFSHVIVDVSSVMALCMRWYPKGKLNLMTDGPFQVSEVGSYKMLRSGNMLHVLASL